jgi:2-oxoglutarate ferredoxin oxidoreductase subunit beta
MLEVKQYLSPEKSTWCPGCGDFGILNAVKSALAMLELYPHQVLLVSGIGCGSKLPHYIRANGFNSIHGRALPIATGARLGNHDLKVIAVTGDGDGYGMGGNHLIHTMRRNPDITHIVENNQVYGLTKGQYSPTSEKGYISTTSPEGALEFAINPMALGLSAGATFLARGFSGDPKQLATLIARAIQHKGYSLVDVLQPCVTFNKINSYDWYRERVYKLEEEPGYDSTDREAAWRKALEWGDRIPLGILYEDTTRPSYEEQLPVLQAGPLAQQPLDGHAAEKWEALKREFM